MVENFKIKGSKDSCYPYVVMSLNHYNPFGEVEFIEQSLKGVGHKGKVLFDLLLVNGNNHNRFFEAIFNGDGIERQSVKVVSSPSKIVRSESVKFYSKNLDLVKDCILPDVLKFKLKKGMLL